MLEIKNVDDDKYSIKNKLIYLDAAASSDPEAETCVDLMYNTMNYWMNPSSIYEYGLQVRRKVEESREKVRRFLHARDEDQIIFGSNGTEMLNIAINSAKYNYEVAISEIEHPALYNQKYYKRVPVDRFGRLDLVRLEEILLEDKYSDFVVAIGHINNEFGVIQNIKEIAKVVHKYNGLILVDCCQSAGHYPIDVYEMGIDMLVFTSEKIGCPRGCAVLYTRNDIDLYPVVYGGGQESGIRSGTENTGMIITMADQCERIQNHWVDRIEKEINIRQELSNVIGEACYGICDWSTVPVCNLMDDDYVKLGDIPVANNIMSVIFDGIDNQQLLTMLDLSNVCCSAGSACSAGGSRKPSRVLMKLGLNADQASNVLRFSFDYRLDVNDVQEFGRRLRKCLLSLTYAKSSESDDE